MKVVLKDLLCLVVIATMVADFVFGLIQPEFVSTSGMIWRHPVTFGVIWFNAYCLMMTPIIDREGAKSTSQDGSRIGELWLVTGIYFHQQVT